MCTTQSQPVTHLERLDGVRARVFIVLNFLHCFCGAFCLHDARMWGGGAGSRGVMSASVGRGCSAMACDAL